jgi:predicted glutamine amidotransferase
MCRMAIAVGEFDASLVLDGFMMMAKGENEKHERNKNAVYNHPDGWGIAYLDGGRFSKYKKQVPVWEDDTFPRFRSIKTNALIIHARRSSSTKRAYENTQPFYRKLPGNEYVFCHNGTIRDIINFDEEFYPLGETDSERLFYYLLSSFNKLGKDALHMSLSSLSNHTAANMILANTQEAFVAVQYTENPAYYTMKLYFDRRCLVICSEILPGFYDARWQSLNNKSLVEINFSTLEYTIEELRKI